MEAYFYAFVNCKQKDWAKLLFIIKFIYNNIKNVNTSHISFEVNFNYYLFVFF